MTLHRLLIPVLLMVPLQAAADNDPRVGQAKTSCAAGEVAQGVRLLAELFTATNDPIWIFNQGRCYQQNGQTQPAIQRFREYLRKTPSPVTAEVAVTRSEAIAYLGELDTEVRRPPPEGRVGLRYAAAASGAVGLSALVAGGIFSALTSAAADRRRQLTAGDRVLEPAESRELGRLSRDGRQYQTLQWIGYGVGAATLAAGIVMYVMARPGSSTHVSPLLEQHAAGLMIGGSL